MTAKQSPEIYQPNGGNALYVFKLPAERELSHKRQSALQ